MNDDEMEPDEPDELEELLAEPHLPLGSVLMAHAGLLRPFGLRFPLDQLLGTGSLGAAYRVPWGAANGSVLKLTRDPTEVEAASLLTGRDSKRIVHIHGVWALTESGGPGLRRWYLVHRSYLHPLNDLDKQLIEMIFALYDETDPADLTLPRSTKQHAMISKWRNYLREELGGGGSMTDHEGDQVVTGARVSTKHIKRSMQLLLQIGSAVDEMHRAGIDWEDIHSDNMMRGNDGKLVIGDVGWGLLHDDFTADIDPLTGEEVHRHMAKFIHAVPDAVPAQP
jgi:serine/threonine protein kinase